MRLKRYIALGQAGIALALLGVLLAVFLNRVALYQELAEKTAMEATAMNMRTGLRFRVIELLLQRQEGKIIDLVNSNPIKFLASPLPNYSGEFDSSKAPGISPGSWYFARDLGEIRYRPMRFQYFVRKENQVAEVRFRVGAASTKSGGAGERPKVKGVNLMLVEPYRWL